MPPMSSAVVEKKCRVAGPSRAPSHVYAIGYAKDKKSQSSGLSQSGLLHVDSTQRHRSNRNQKPCHVVTKSSLQLAFAAGYCFVIRLPFAILSRSPVTSFLAVVYCRPQWLQAVSTYRYRSGGYQTVESTFACNPRFSVVATCFGDGGG